MAISTADAAQLRKGQQRDERPSEPAPSERKDWKAKFGASFRVSPAAWIFIILLSFASAVTTGVAFEEFLSNSDGRSAVTQLFQIFFDETPRIVSISLATILTIATQGILVYASIEFSSALLSVVRSILPATEGDGTRPPSRSGGHAVLRRLVAVGSSAVAVIFFAIFLALPMIFSVHFSYATLHRELEDKDKVRREALERLEAEYILAHGVVAGSLEQRYNDLVRADALWRPPHSSGAQATDRLESYLRDVNSLINELADRRPVAIEFDKDGQPVDPTLSEPSNLAAVIEFGWKSRRVSEMRVASTRANLAQEKSQNKAKLDSQVARLNTLKGRETRVEADISDRSEELDRIKVALQFELDGCLGVAFDRLGSREQWETLVSYLLRRDEDRARCSKSDIEWIGDNLSVNYNSASVDLEAPFLNKLSELRAIDDPSARANVKRIESALLRAESSDDLDGILIDENDDTSPSFSRGRNCTGGSGSRWACLRAREVRLGGEDGELSRLQDELEDIREDILFVSSDIAEKGRTDVQLTNRIENSGGTDPVTGSIDAATLLKHTGIVEAAREASALITGQTITSSLQDDATGRISPASFVKLKSSCQDASETVRELIPNEFITPEVISQINEIFNCSQFDLDPRTLRELNTLSTQYEMVVGSACEPGSFEGPTSGSVGLEVDASLAIPDQHSFQSNEPLGDLDLPFPTQMASRVYSVDDVDIPTPPAKALPMGDADKIAAYRSSERIRCLTEPVQLAGLGQQAGVCASDYRVSANTFDGSSNVIRSFVKLGEFLGAGNSARARNASECFLSNISISTEDEKVRAEVVANSDDGRLDFEEDLFEFGAYAVAWWIDGAVLLLGFLATLRLARAEDAGITLDHQIDQTIGTNRVALRDFLAALRLDPGERDDWWTVFDPEDLKDTRHLAEVERFLSIVNADVMPAGDTQYRLSKRLVSALERAAA